MADDTPPMLACVEGTVGPFAVTCVMRQARPVIRIQDTEIDSTQDFSLPDAVALARLLVKAAAHNGYGADDGDRQRLIAWANVRSA